MIKISIREELPRLHPKRRIKKILDKERNMFVGDFSDKMENFMDMMEVRQKLLMAYQNSQFYDKKRFGNLLKKVQARILSRFDSAVDMWIANHDSLKFANNDEGFKKALQAMESLASKWGVSPELPPYGKRYQEYERFTDYLVSSARAGRLTEEALIARLHSYNDGNEKMMKKDLGYVMAIIKGVMERYDKTMNVKKYITNALKNGDIDSQIVAFEQALNAVHNSGPMLDYVVDSISGGDYERHDTLRGDIMKKYLDWLSSMKNEELELNEEDLNKIASIGDKMKKIATVNLEQLKQYPEDNSPVSMGQKPMVKKIIAFLKQSYTKAADLIKQAGGLSNWLRNYFDQDVPSDVINRAATVFAGALKASSAKQQYRNKIVRLASQRRKK